MVPCLWVFTTIVRLFEFLDELFELFEVVVLAIGFLIKVVLEG